jgi:aspartyl protease family protein
MPRLYVLIVCVVAGLVVGRLLTDPPSEPSPAPAKQTKTSKPRANTEVVLARAGNGQFYVDADINGTSVRMLADTGASLVALGEDVAENIGLDTDNLDYEHAVETANGTTAAAVVVLDEVRVGGIVRHDVRAVVTRGLSGALLGMSFFNTLSKVSIESDELVLKD